MKHKFFIKHKTDEFDLAKVGYCKRKLPIGFKIDDIIENLNIIETKIGAFKGRQNKIADVSFHSSFLDESKEYKQTIWESFIEPLTILVKYSFENFKIVQINIFNKPPGAGYVCPHQNLSIVDERLFKTYSIWIPLQEVNSENGRLQFIKSSHNKFEPYRSADIYWKPLSVFEENINNLPFTSVDLEMGDFLVFDDRIVHYSENNLSKTNRYVLHCLVAPIHATCVYPKIKDDKVYLYRVSDDFWHYFTPGEYNELTDIYDIVDFILKDYDLNSVVNEINRKT
jgi:hypothetical protein